MEYGSQNVNLGHRQWAPTGILFALAAAAACALVIAHGTPERAAASTAVASYSAAPPEGTHPWAAPQTTKKAVWGVISHNGRSLFPTYRDLGVGILQTQARWDDIARRGRPDQPTDPDDPAYRWPQFLEDSVAEAERYGMKVSIQLIGTPHWANEGRAWRWAPTEPQDFADFSTAIARKFPNVNLWMVWGEPNRKPNFAPFTGMRPTANKLTKKQARAPRIYSQLLDAAYGALKADNPANQVIGGNTYTSGGPEVIRPFQWVRYMKLPDGSRPRMDMWGHNPYSYRKPNLRNRPSPLGRVDFSDLGRLARALDRAFPGPPLKLFLSEWGVPTQFDHDFHFAVSPDTSARWTRAALRIVRRWERIYTLGWAVPVDTPRNPQGLLDSAGSPKPAYEAFKAG